MKILSKTLLRISPIDFELFDDIISCRDFADAFANLLSIRTKYADLKGKCVSIIDDLIENEGNLHLKNTLINVKRVVNQDKKIKEKHLRKYGSKFGFFDVEMFNTLLQEYSDTKTDMESKYKESVEEKLLKAKLFVEKDENFKKALLLSSPFLLRASLKTGHL